MKANLTIIRQISYITELLIFCLDTIKKFFEEIRHIQL